MEEKLMTTRDFNLAVRKWARKVKNAIAQKVLSSTKKSSGRLAGSVRFKQKFYKGVTETIGFDFLRHGVFYQTGTGRGHIMYEGKLVRGYLASEDQVNILLQRGYTRKEAKRMKYVTGGKVNRRPVDWFNGKIEFEIRELADIAQEYYGDLALKHILDKYDYLFINKRRNG